jgi:hypothetical protein
VSAPFIDAEEHKRVFPDAVLHEVEHDDSVGKQIVNGDSTCGSTVTYQPHFASQENHSTNADESRDERTASDANGAGKISDRNKAVEDKFTITDRPLPREALGGSGKRRVPALVSANQIPFLRYKKPQPLALTQYINTRIKQRNKRHLLRTRLEAEVEIANSEDAWDTVLRRYARFRDTETSSHSPENLWAHETRTALQVVTDALAREKQNNARMAALMWDVVDQEQALAEKERLEDEEREKLQGQKDTSGGGASSLSSNRPSICGFRPTAPCRQEQLYLDESVQRAGNPNPLTDRQALGDVKLEALQVDERRPSGLEDPQRQGVGEPQFSEFGELEHQEELNLEDQEELNRMVGDIKLEALQVDEWQPSGLEDPQWQGVGEPQFPEFRELEDQEELNRMVIKLEALQVDERRPSGLRDPQRREPELPKDEKLEDHEELSQMVDELVDSFEAPEGTLSNFLNGLRGSGGGQGSAARRKPIPPDPLDGMVKTAETSRLGGDDTGTTESTYVPYRREPTRLTDPMERSIQATLDMAITGVRSELNGDIQTTEPFMLAPETLDPPTHPPKPSLQERPSASLDGTVNPAETSHRDDIYVPYGYYYSERLGYLIAVSHL